jgi:hypothetical protein
MTPLPCPFCGTSLVEAHETTSYRWAAATCLCCGAIGPDTRKNEDGDDIPGWEQAAIKRWNERTAYPN